MQLGLSSYVRFMTLLAVVFRAQEPPVASWRIVRSRMVSPLGSVLHSHTGVVTPTVGDEMGVGPAMTVLDTYSYPVGRVSVSTTLCAAGPFSLWMVMRSPPPQTFMLVLPGISNPSTGLLISRARVDSGGCTRQLSSQPYTRRAVLVLGMVQSTLLGMVVVMNSHWFCPSAGRSPIVHDTMWEAARYCAVPRVTTAVELKVKSEGTKSETQTL